MRMRTSGSMAGAIPFEPWCNSQTELGLIARIFTSLGLVPAQVHPKPTYPLSEAPSSHLYRRS